LSDEYVESKLEGKDIKKNRIDDREYRYIILKNKMKILLVHDKDVEKSGVCNTVACGNLLDP